MFIDLDPIHLGVSRGRILHAPVSRLNKTALDFGAKELSDGIAKLIKGPQQRWMESRVKFRKRMVSSQGNSYPVACSSQQQIRSPTRQTKTSRSRASTEQKAPNPITLLAKTKLRANSLPVFMRKQMALSKCIETVFDKMRPELNTGKMTCVRGIGTIRTAR